MSLDYGESLARFCRPLNSIFKRLIQRPDFSLDEIEAEKEFRCTYIRENFEAVLNYDRLYPPWPLSQRTTEPCENQKIPIREGSSPNRDPFSLDFGTIKEGRRRILRTDIINKSSQFYDDHPNLVDVLDLDPVSRALHQSHILEQQHFDRAQQEAKERLYREYQLKILILCGNQSTSKDFCTKSGWTCCHCHSALADCRRLQRIQIERDYFNQMKDLYKQELDHYTRIDKETRDSTISDGLMQLRTQFRKVLSVFEVVKEASQPLRQGSLFTKDNQKDLTHIIKDLNEVINSLSKPPTLFMNNNGRRYEIKLGPPDSCSSKRPPQHIQELDQQESDIELSTSLLSTSLSERLLSSSPDPVSPNHPQQESDIELSTSLLSTSLSDSGPTLISNKNQRPLKDLEEEDKSEARKLVDDGTLVGIALKKLYSRGCAGWVTDNQKGYDFIDNYPDDEEPNIHPAIFKTELFKIICDQILDVINKSVDEIEKFTEDSQHKFGYSYQESGPKVKQLLDEWAVYDCQLFYSSLGDFVPENPEDLEAYRNIFKDIVKPIGRGFDKNLNYERRPIEFHLPNICHYQQESHILMAQDQPCLTWSSQIVETLLNPNDPEYPNDSDYLENLEKSHEVERLIQERFAQLYNNSQARIKPREEDIPPGCPLKKPKIKYNDYFEFEVVTAFQYDPERMAKYSSKVMPIGISPYHLAKGKYYYLPHQLVHRKVSEGFPVYKIQSTGFFVCSNRGTSIAHKDKHFKAWKTRILSNEVSQTGKSSPSQVNSIDRREHPVVLFELPKDEEFFDSADIALSQKEYLNLVQNHRKVEETPFPVLREKHFPYFSPDNEPTDEFKTERLNARKSWFLLQSKCLAPNIPIDVPIPILNSYLRIGSFRAEERYSKDPLKWDPKSRQHIILPLSGNGPCRAFAFAPDMDIGLLKKGDHLRSVLEFLGQEEQDEKWPIEILGP